MPIDREDRRLVLELEDHLIQLSGLIKALQLILHEGEPQMCLLNSIEAKAKEVMLCYFRLHYKGELPNLGQVI